MEGCHLFPCLLPWPEAGLREPKPKLSCKPRVALYLCSCPKSIASAFILSFSSLSAFLKGIYFIEMQFVYPRIHSSVHLSRFSKHRESCSHHHNLNLELPHGASKEASPLCICSPLESPPEVPASKRPLQHLHYHLDLSLRQLGNPGCWGLLSKNISIFVEVSGKDGICFHLAGDFTKRASH